MVMATSPVQADEAQVNNKEQQTQAEIQQKEKKCWEWTGSHFWASKVVTQNEAVKELEDKAEPSKTEVSAPVSQSQPVSQIDNTKEASQPSLERRKSNLLNQLQLSRKARKKAVLAEKLLLGARDR